MSDKVVAKFFQAKKDLFEHVGLMPDWVEFPLDDCTEMYWKVNENSVSYSEDREKIDTGERYEDEGCTISYYQHWAKYWMKVKQEDTRGHYKEDIYTQRFYPKWVYRGKQFTLIFCDPHVDGCRWWRIFDNKKEIK